MRSLIFKLYAFVADGDFCSVSSPSESSKHLVPCACHNSESCKLGMQDGKETLESLWKKAIEICQSNSLKTTLRKHGKLSSISFTQGTYIFMIFNFFF